jgi:hypothetical protein
MDDAAGGRPYFVNCTVTTIVIFNWNLLAFLNPQSFRLNICRPIEE